MIIKMINYTVRKDDNNWLSIDIDKWIDSLELNKKIMVINVIKEYENILVDDTSTTFSSAFTLKYYILAKNNLR